MNKKITLSLMTVLLASTVAMAETTKEIIDESMKSADVEAKYVAASSVNAASDLKQNLNLGFTNTSGNSKTVNINGKYDASYTTTGYADEKLKVAFDASAFVTENNKVKDNEEYAANLGLEQYITDGWLGYTSVSWLRNRFRNFDSKLSVGAGIGKELFNDGTQSLKFKMGGAYNIEEYTVDALFDNELLGNRNFASLNEYMEYNYKINTSSNFFLKVGASENFEDITKDYEVLTTLGLNFSVAENISVTLEQEIAFDNIPAGQHKTDTKSIVRVGYTF